MATDAQITRAKALLAALNLTFADVDKLFGVGQGCVATAIDHADAAGTTLITAPADSSLACLVRIKCTESAAGSTTLATATLGTGTDADAYDDGTLYTANDSANDTFDVEITLAAGASLVATPVNGTGGSEAGKWTHTVISSRI